MKLKKLLKLINKNEIICVYDKDTRVIGTRKYNIMYNNIYLDRKVFKIEFIADFDSRVESKINIHLK